MRHNEGKVLEEEIQDYKRVIERKGEYLVSSDPLIWECPSGPPVLEQRELGYRLGREMLRADLYVFCLALYIQ